MRGRARWSALLLGIGLALGLLPAASFAEEAEDLRWGRLSLVVTGSADTLALRRALDLEGRRVEESPLAP